MKIKVHEHKKSEGFKDYKAIQEWLENVMDKADTMFGRAYVTDNRPGEIAVEIEGWDSSDGDCIVSLVFDEGDTFEETLANLDEELGIYSEDFDPDEEAKMYADSNMAGVPSLRVLIKAMDERKKDMRTLSNAVHKAVKEL